MKNGLSVSLPLNVGVVITVYSFSPVGLICIRNIIKSAQELDNLLLSNTSVPLSSLTTKVFNQRSSCKLFALVNNEPKRNWSKKTVITDSTEVSKARYCFLESEIRRLKTTRPRLASLMCCY